MSENAVRRPTSLTSEFLEGLVQRVPGSTGNTWKLTEVYTGDLLVELPQSSEDDIAQAFAAARAAQQVWASWPLRKRLKVLKKFHALVLEHQFLITDLIQAESGKNRRMAFEESCDVPMGTSHYIKRARTLLKDRRHAGPVPVLSHSTEVRRPKGVVAIIAPWNFPFATGISDTIPALIAGNGVVLKPDNKTALSPLLGVRLLEQAGMPPGLVQVVCGEGPDVGEPMLANADYVMFTGSTATGRVIGELAGKNLIGCCLELGGKNPMLVLEDADVDEAVHAALFGGFGNSGQICMHIERLYVHDSIYVEFRDKFVAATEALNIGAAYDFGPDLGSLVSVDHRDRVAAHVEDARAKGATVLTGGQARPDLGPAFYEPTILEGVTQEMLAGSTETFGPVVGLYPFHSEDEAIALANDTSYGLNASVWSTDLDRAQSVARRIDSGNVNINDILATAFASKGTPSGGLKQSGVGARHGDQGLLKYTDAQSIAVLKKQVMEPQGNQTYDAYAKQTQMSLKWMRKTRLR
ncbi:MAG: succinic semialdehyde dehydrogenase [Aeromicrobium sp.]